MTKLITNGVWKYALGVLLTVTSLSATGQAQKCHYRPFRTDCMCRNQA
ncbi:MAG: hypothetical protein IPN36_03690 [Bacteroidetes bacterium]|nr:hypothetical protein [Bacteroidota bacterium]